MRKDNITNRRLIIQEKMDNREKKKKELEDLNEKRENERRTKIEVRIRKRQI